MLNTTTAGSALITKVIAGANVNITNTGVDAGTGDVTVNVGPVLPSAEGGGMVLTIGNTGAVGSTNPTSLVLDNSYSTTAGQHLKLTLYSTTFGLGVSAGQLDVATGAGDAIAFWAGGTKLATLNGAAGLTLATPLAVADGGTAARLSP